jgi:hypothetical protein
MFVSAKVLNFNDGIYYVEIEDSELGLLRASFELPLYDEITFHRCIAYLHWRWIQRGNGNPVQFPEISVTMVNELLNEVDAIERGLNDEKINACGLVLPDSGSDSCPGLPGAPVILPGSESRDDTSGRPSIRQGPEFEPDEGRNPSITTPEIGIREPGPEPVAQDGGNTGSDNPDPGVA